MFDVNMSFTSKARWVLDRHKTPSPVGSTCAGLVFRENVRIAFTYAALNGLDVIVADIKKNHTLRLHRRRIILLHVVQNLDLRT